jgi:hypothetical protein
VLKKAGIVVAAAAAGLLAVSPLAFAGEMGDHGDHGHHHKAPSYSKHDDHSVKSDRSVTYDHSPSCNFARQDAVNGVSQPATGVASPFLGLVGLAIPVAVPINANVQAPILSCNNVEDVLNPRIDHNLNGNDL